MPLIEEGAYADLLVVASLIGDGNRHALGAEHARPPGSVICPPPGTSVAYLIETVRKGGRDHAGSENDGTRCGREPARPYRRRRALDSGGWQAHQPPVGRGDEPRPWAQDAVDRWRGTSRVRDLTPCANGSLCHRRENRGGDSWSCDDLTGAWCSRARSIKLKLRLTPATG